MSRVLSYLGQDGLLHLLVSIVLCLFLSALIRQRYSLSEELAVLRILRLCGGVQGEGDIIWEGGAVGLKL